MNADKGSLILSVTENGYGKRTAADEYRLQGRGGSGVINVKTTERNGKVVGIAQVTENSEVMLISQYGKIIRMDSNTIRESGRAAQGVRLLHLEPGDRVAAAVVIPPEEEPITGRGADSVGAIVVESFCLEGGASNRAPFSRRLLRPSNNYFGSGLAYAGKLKPGGQFEK